ncbi:MAG: inorganic pyrophosphatase [Anaerolineae bacterium]
MLAADGEEQDIYLLGVDTPVETFTGTIIAILKRADDVEDKLVMAPAGVDFQDGEIIAQTYFQERYFQTTLHRKTSKLD